METFDLGEGYRSLPRGRRAEFYVEQVISLPLISEFVFRSPQRDTAEGEREVVDLLISTDEVGLLFSLKCQDGDKLREGARAKSWCEKSATKAVSQLKGALKSIKETEVRCTHPRRGLVTFSKGLPQIDHLIACIETEEGMYLTEREGIELPLEFDGISITYITVKDFLYLCFELRTLAEVNRYLADRRTILSISDLRLIGAERTLYGAYILGNGSFPDVTCYREAQNLVIRNEAIVQEGFRLKQADLAKCALIEKVAHELSTRDANIPAELESQYEPLASRTGYLQMQGIFAHLRFADRAYLGGSLLSIIEAMDSSAGDDCKNLRYKVAMLDGMADVVFVLGASKQMDRLKLAQAIDELCVSAPTFFRKTRCLVIVDRDGESFELMLSKTDQTLADTAPLMDIGRRRFGHLKIISQPASFIPAGVSLMDIEKIRNRATCSFEKFQQVFLVRSPLLDNCLGIASTDNEAHRLFDLQLNALYERYLTGVKVGPYQLPDDSKHNN